MKERVKQLFSQKTTFNYRTENFQFRIRSSSKRKSLSSSKKFNENSIEEGQNFNQIEKFDGFEKLKISDEQLTKVFVHARHQRQRSNISQHFQPNPSQILEDPLKNNNLQNFEANPSNDSKKKIFYEGVKTEESHLKKKSWFDVNGIDTSENIKMLDRITTLYDPFRIINECNSKKKIEKESEESRVKSISTKKSKLTEKINNLVFEVNSKSKQKNGSDLNYKKFGPLCRPNSECKNYEQAFGDPQINKNTFRKEISTPKLPKRKCSTPLTKEKQSDVFCKQNKKSQKYTKNLLLGVSQNKPKHKINVDQLKENKRNDAMDKYWSGVNESLILASQDSYVSLDLNDLVYNNMR